MRPLPFARAVAEQGIAIISAFASFNSALGELWDAMGACYARSPIRDGQENRGIGSPWRAYIRMA
jgi:hypothetical protein